MELYICFYNVMHKYKVTSDAVNIYSNPDNLVKRIKSDLDKHSYAMEHDLNTNNVYELEYIVYADMMFKTINSLGIHIVDNLLPKKVVEYFANHPSKFVIENYLSIDGYDKPIAIKDFSLMMKNYDSLLEYSYESTKKRVTTDLDDLRDRYMSKLGDNTYSPRDKSMFIAIIGNTYDLTESIIDNNKEDLSDKITEEIKNIRYEYENTEDPENEWEFINQQVETILKGDKDITIKKCTYNGKEIEYDELVRKLISHVFPQYLTQVDINTTLDDYYIIETDKCKIIRSIGGDIRVERVHDKEENNNV